MAKTKGQAVKQIYKLYTAEELQWHLLKKKLEITPFHDFVSLDVCGFSVCLHLPQSTRFQTTFLMQKNSFFNSRCHICEIPMAFLWSFELQPFISEIRKIAQHHKGSSKND